jgi:succinate-semialdehyde dehydrogenase
VIVDDDADLTEAVGKIVLGASFDNGIICSHEQFVLVPERKWADSLAAFEATGKVWYSDNPEIVQKFRDLVFPGGRLNKDVVGRSCRELGAMIGLDIPVSARIVLLPAKGAGADDVLAKEKLCPVVAIMPYKDFNEAVARAKANLLVEGAGHSAAMHSNNDAHIRTAGMELPVSRLVVNQPSSFSAGGALNNGFAPTTTLGCGSWGGNSISENLDYKHLMNVSRIGKVIANRKIPTDAEIWA